MTDYVIGGGVTGLAAGMASGFTVLEAREAPGGICCSYYLRPGEAQRLLAAPRDSEAYRFEIGGGHWIFGGDPAVIRLLSELAEMREYRRASSVYLRERAIYVPYPIQNNLRFLGPELAALALGEMAQPASSPKTMRDWLLTSFGTTLCREFFFPFHELYTCALYREIAPQDSYKSPAALSEAIRGSFAETAPTGYNIRYLYPVSGLDQVARALATRCLTQYGTRVVKIDTDRRELQLADGRCLPYRRLISTLPLNNALVLAGIKLDVQPDPYTSVVVLNIGAVRGRACPPDHWIYVSSSSSGFHRIGFYSNVDPAFVPGGSASNRASLYVERAFRGGQQPSAMMLDQYASAAIAELQDWGYIGSVEVVDPTWIEVAYTWSWPGSTWRREAIEALEGKGIATVGRYGRWVFQGIADSIRDGLFVGAASREAA